MSARLTPPRPPFNPAKHLDWKSNPLLLKAVENYHRCVAVYERRLEMIKRGAIFIRPLDCEHTATGMRLPHQGEQECARRRRQIAAGILRVS